MKSLKIKKQWLQISEVRDFQPRATNAARLQIKDDGRMKAFFRYMQSQNMFALTQYFLENYWKVYFMKIREQTKNETTWNNYKEETPPGRKVKGILCTAAVHWPWEQPVQAEGRTSKEDADRNDFENKQTGGLMGLTILWAILHFFWKFLFEIFINMH